MIALERDMPQQCLHDNCPCMQTITAEDEHGRKVMARLCMAHGGTILCIYDLTDNPPEEWMEFKRPSWCPLIDMTEPSYDKEFEREWLSKQQCDLEDGDMFGY